MERDDLVPVIELCRYYQIEYGFVTALSERGLIEVMTIEEIHYLTKSQLAELEKIMRMHFEMEINFEGIEAVTHLLKRVEALQRELRRERNRSADEALPG